MTIQRRIRRLVYIDLSSLRSLSTLRDGLVFAQARKKRWCRLLIWLTRWPAW